MARSRKPAPRPKAKAIGRVKVVVETKEKVLTVRKPTCELTTESVGELTTVPVGELHGPNPRWKREPSSEERKRRIEALGRGNLLGQELERQSRGYWPKQIKAAWQKTAAAIIETSQLLNRAKDALEHGRFTRMIEHELPFSPRTAQMLMRVANNPVLTNAKHVSFLPPSWSTLHELAKVNSLTLEKKLADGTITPKLERKDVETKVLGRPRTAAKRTKLDRVQRIRQELDCAKAHIAELEAARGHAEAPDKDEPAIEEEVDPEHYYTALMLRVDQAARFAGDVRTLADKVTVTREVAHRARCVAEAWDRLATDLEARMLSAASAAKH